MKNNMYPLSGILIFAMLLIMTACSASEKQDNQTNNKEIVERYFGYFNQHDWKNMAEMYTETAQFKDPSLGKGIVPMTRAEIEAKYAGMHEMIPDIHDQIIATYPAGEKHIIIEFISTGSLPDQSTFELPICTIFTIENGKIAADYSYFDNADM